MTEWPNPETHLQAQIKARAERLGFSMRRLSQAAGKNETAVKAIMKGKSKNPRGDTLQAIAQVLGTTVQELLGEVDNRDADAESSAVSTPRNEAVEALRERERQLASEIEEHLRGSERASLRLDEVRSMLAKLCRAPDLNHEPPATPPPPQPNGTDPPCPFPKAEGEDRLKEKQGSGARPNLRLVPILPPAPVLEA